MPLNRLHKGLMAVLFIAFSIVLLLTGCREKQLPATAQCSQIDQLNRLATSKYEQSIDSAFHYILQVLEALKGVHYPKGKADLENNLGIFYAAKGNTGLALRYYKAAHEHYQQLNDSSNIVQTLMNMAMVYVATGNRQRAKASYGQAIRIGSHLTSDSIMSLLYYNYLLQFPERLGADSTEYFLGQIASIAQKYRDQRILIALNQLIADRQIDSGRLTDGISLLKQTIQEALAREYNYAAMDMYADLGDRLLQRYPDSSLYYYNEAYRLAREKNYNNYITLFTKRLYDFYKQQGQPERALAYSDSLLFQISQRSQRLNISGVDYVDYALKEKELEAARQKSAYNGRLVLLISVICLLALITLIILWYNRKKEKKNQKILQLQYEQASAAKEALHRLFRNYDKLIKVIAHDLRNPIGAIYSISSLLKQQHFSSENNQLIEMIHTAANNSTALISQLLETDFNRQLQPNRQRVDLDELLAITIQLLQFRANEKHQLLQYKGSKSVVAAVDKNLMVRVIDNLVTNAIKFSDERSTILITLTVSGEHLRISVRDHGIGIPRDQQDKIFNAATCTKRPGTQGEPSFGFGLYMSREIVTAHQGKLYLNTKVEEGSEFIIELPLDGQ